MRLPRRPAAARRRVHIDLYHGCAPPSERSAELLNEVLGQQVERLLRLVSGLLGLLTPDTAYGVLGASVSTRLAHLGHPWHYDLFVPSTGSPAALIAATRCVVAVAFGHGPLFVGRELHLLRDLQPRPCGVSCCS